MVPNPSRNRTFAMAASAAAGGALLLVALRRRAFSDPSGAGLAPRPLDLLAVAAAAVVSGLLVLVLPARLRDRLATALPPLALIALVGLERPGMTGRSFSLLAIASAIALALVALVAQARARDLLLRGGRGVAAVLALALVAACAIPATLLDGVVRDGFRLPLRTYEYNGRTLRMRALPEDVTYRQTLQLHDVAVIALSVGASGAADASAPPRLQVSVRQSGRTFTASSDIAPAPGESGALTRSFSWPGLTAGAAVLELSLPRGPRQLLFGVVDVRDGTPEGYAGSLPPAASPLAHGTPLCAAGALASCRRVLAAGTVRDAAIVGPNGVALTWPAPVAKRLRFPITVPSQLWTGPVRVRLELRGRTVAHAETSIESAGDGWAALDVDVAEPAPSGLRIELRPVGAVPHGTLFALGEPLPLSSPAAPRSVVLVSVDTLRADRMGAYGARHPTPALDRLAARGTLFLRATSLAPWTVPSHASLFASRPPADLATFARGCESPTPFTTTAPLLAERLAEAGYETVAFTGGGYVAAAYGFDRGFEAYQATNSRGREIAGIPRGLEHWIATRRGGPFFLFLHTYRAHYPYDSDRYASELPPDADRIERLANDYDGAVAEADAIVGGCLERLERAGLLEDALVVLVSDHGEELGERLPETTGWGHCSSLYDEQLHVPLVLAGPGVSAGLRIVTPVTLLDVAPTILAHAGVAAPAEWLGRSLAPLLRDGEVGARPAFIEQFPCEGLDRRGVQLANMRVVVAASGTVPFATSVYDLEADPGERRPLSFEECPAAGDLAQLARERFTLGPAADGELPAPTDEEAEQLRALGYLR